MAYKNGTKLDFTDYSHIKSVQILTTDAKLSETINTYKISPGFLSFLFVDPSWVDSERFQNPGVKSLRHDYKGDSNVIFQNSLKNPKIYNEARRIFGKNEVNAISKADFYKNKFCVALDLRSHQDNNTTGSGVSNTIGRTQAGFTVHFLIKTGRTKKLTMEVFLISHGQAQIQNNSLANVLI